MQWIWPDLNFDHSCPSFGCFPPAAIIVEGRSNRPGLYQRSDFQPSADSGNRRTGTLFPQPLRYFTRNPRSDGTFGGLAFLWWLLGNVEKEDTDSETEETPQEHSTLPANSP